MRLQGDSDEVIEALQHKVHAIAQTELEAALNRLEGLSIEEKHLVQHLAERIERCLTHTPTQAIEQADLEYRVVLAAVMQNLFELEQPHESS